MIGILFYLVLTAAAIILNVIMLFLTTYMQYTSYINTFLINLVWAALHYLGGATTGIWYPEILESGSRNFLLVTAIMIVGVLIIFRFPKIRLAYFISSNVAVGAVIIGVVMQLMGQELSGKYAVILVGFTVLTVVFQYGADGYMEVDDEGNVVSRLVAMVFLMPAPFIMGLIVCEYVLRMPETGSRTVIAAATAVIAGLLYFVVDSIRDARNERYANDYYGPVTRMYFNEETGRLEVLEDA